MGTFGGNPILLISLISSLAGLSIIYVASTNTQPSYVNINDINMDLVGRTISTSGRITDVQLNPKGHIFLTISDGGKTIEVALFSDLVKALSDAGINSKSFTKGKSINVSGTLDIYNIQFQIIPRKASDLKIG